MKEAKAVGRADSPVLVVMLSAASARMMNWFWKMLLEAGIQKTDVRIVYLLDDAPAGSGGRPLKSQLRASRDRFMREIEVSSPRVVIPMGPDAVYAVTGIRSSKTDKTTIFDTRGYLIRADLFEEQTVESFEQIGVYKRASKATGAKAGDPRMGWVKRSKPGPLGADFKGIVIPSFGLDQIRMDGFASKPALKEDLHRVRRALDGELVELDRDMEYYETRYSVRAPGFTSPLEGDLFQHEWGPMISVDIETHGIDNEVIDLVSLCDGLVTASLEWNQETRDFISRIFELPKRIYLVHNSPFDIPRLVRNGVTISQRVIDEQIFDTMYGSVVLQPDLHKGLGRIASVYLDLTPWKWRKISEGDPRYYSAKDALVTYWLGYQEVVVMKQLGTWDLYMGQGQHPGPGVMATIPELTLASEGGLRLNRPRAIELGGRLERKLFRLLKLWARTFPETNPLSNPQLHRLLYRDWGLPIERTKADGITVNELSLLRLKAFVQAQKTNPHYADPWQTDERAVPRIFDLLLAIRDTHKLFGTYVTPAMANEEAYIHPQYLPVSKDDERGGKKMDNKGNTATGRLASYRPNIQNQPKKMRDLYSPDRDDMCFVQLDYKSAELYVLAGMSGDERLLADLQGDMHQRNADRFGISRKVAKNVVYASQYLASPSKQSEMIYAQEHLWVSPADCQMISQQMWAHYADATAYKNMIIGLCNTQKFIRNPFGRVRFFHDGSAPAAVDFIPQSTVADILWCVLKPVAQLARKFGGRLVTTVHDSILACIPQANVAAFATAAKGIMQRPFDCVRPGFYIPVEVEVAAPGEPWSKVKPYVQELKAA